MSENDLTTSHAYCTKRAIGKEGFLCPICLDDLQSFHNLQRHFDSEHSNEDKAVVKDIKGVFSRARKKIFSKDSVEDDLSLAVSMPVASQLPHDLDISFWEPQETGMLKHHMDVFRRIRDERIDRAVVETNKILIRLDKLLQMLGTDQRRRKGELERSVVPWVQDDDVPFCVTCGSKFNIALRRHHCRLCGAIMCSRCSIFLVYHEAEEILKKNKQFDQIEVRQQKQTCTLEDSERDVLSLRICVGCDDIVHQSQEKLNLQFSLSLLVKLHEKMTSAMDAAEKLRPEFQNMAQSLNMGEVQYKLDIATQKRNSLMQMFEAVDVLSKKISVLNVSDEENPLSPGAQKLQHSIRKAACAYLQDNMLSLPSLPSAPKLLALQTRRRAENEKRLRWQREEAQRLRAEQRRKQELERRMMEREMAQDSISSQGKSDTPSPQVVATVGDPGWSATAVETYHRANVTMHHDDDSKKDLVLSALKEQISYVEESLRQANAAGMLSEASSLGSNLQELKSEYKKRYASRAFAVSSGDHQNASSELLGENPKESGENGAEDVMLHQIEYISKCIEDAEAAGKFDEVKILTDNLDEIRLLYAERLKE